MRLGAFYSTLPSGGHLLDGLFNRKRPRQGSFTLPGVQMVAAAHSALAARRCQACAVRIRRKLACLVVLLTLIGWPLSLRFLPAMMAAASGLVTGAIARTTWLTATPGNSKP